MYELKGDFMKKKILAIVLGLTLCFGMTGCASWDRFVVDMKSDANGGMQRTITVYTADGKELATYKGVMISKENASKDMFKIDLLNMLQGK